MFFLDSTQDMMQFEGSIKISGNWKVLLIDMNINIMPIYDSIYEVYDSI